MNRFTSIVIAFTLLVLSSCSSKYEREKGCALDILGLKGNVVKVETIAKTTMPVTEMQDNVLYLEKMYGFIIGNNVVDFDNHGNVKHVSYYGVNGEKIKSCDFLGGNEKLCNLIILTPETCSHITDIKTKQLPSGKEETDFFINDFMLCKSIMTYDSIYRTPNNIVKYYYMEDYDKPIATDTTYYSYKDHDEFGNWTECEINYIGLIPRHCNTIYLKRQITYSGQSAKPELMEKFAEYNRYDYMDTVTKQTVCFGNGNSLTLPTYMHILTEEEKAEKETDYFKQLKYDLDSRYYKSSEAYVTFMISSTVGSQPFSDEELVYNEETDDYLKDMFTETLATDQTYILKWLPYQSSIVSGYKSIVVRYYRYGKGSPIPVYCEIYTVPANGITYTISFSVQSTLYNQFYQDLKNVIKSIKINY